MTCIAQQYKGEVPYFGKASGEASRARPNACMCQLSAEPLTGSCTVAETDPMDLSHREADQIFKIMAVLSGEHSCHDTRLGLGQRLLDLLDADFFASYVWNEMDQAFSERVHLNMSDRNLDSYEQHFQFCDPITHRLMRRRKATPVSAVMAHRRLVRTEFYTDFLKLDGLCYGLNYFAYNRGRTIGDLRIWRSRRKADFTARDAQIVDAIGPAFANALRRAQTPGARGNRRFAAIAEVYGLSARETEIADMVVCGLSDDEIAGQLCVSYSTVRTHIRLVFAKTGVPRWSALAGLLL